MSDQQFATGCLERSRECGAFMPVATDIWPTIPESQWTPQEPLEWAETLDLNQASNNSCCLTSLANAIIFHFRINGRPVVEPDWLTIWRKLAGGRNVGVALDDALNEVLQNGYPIKGSTDRIWFDEVADCPDYRSFVSGVRCGLRGIYGRSMGRGGHAEHASYVKDAKTLRIRGSWGRTYGQQGWYDVPISDLARSMNRYGAFLVREIKIMPGELSGLEDSK